MKVAGRICLVAKYLYIFKFRERSLIKNRQVGEDRENSKGKHEYGARFETLTVTMTVW